jgi:hypothetical protein
MTPTDGTPIVITVPATNNVNPGLLITPAGMPNVRVKVIEPIVIIAVRAGRVYLQTLLGLLTAGLAKPTLLGAADFIHLFGMCASLSLAPAVVCVVQNVIELMAKFDQSHPTIAG